MSARASTTLGARLTYVQTERCGCEDPAEEQER
jgi:hypothetical protein